MKENNLIKKMAASLTKKHKNIFIDRRIMHPEREWFASLFLSLLVLLGGVFFMIFHYYQFSDVTIEAVELAEEGVIYRSGLVKDVLDDFKLRKDNYAELKKELIDSRASVENVPGTIAESALPEEVVVEEAIERIDVVPVIEQDGEEDTVPIMSI